MINLKNDVVVITGAASGIGQQLAVQLAEQGCSLALCDTNIQGLQETVRLISNSTVNIKIDQLDVSDQDAVGLYAETIKNHFGKVNRLINNAGKTGGDLIQKISIDNFKLIMDINFYGVLYVTKAFLPHLIAQSNSSIVNIASVNSFVPFPTNGAYNCSKYAVQGLSETLQQELINENVFVTSVHPGGVRTNIIKNSNKADALKTDEDLKIAQEKFHKITLTTADVAAKKIIKAMRKKKKKVIIGMDAKFMSWAKRLFPSLAVAQIGKTALKMQHQGTTKK